MVIFIVILCLVSKSSVFSIFVILMLNIKDEFFNLSMVMFL